MTREEYWSKWKEKFLSKDCIYWLIYYFLAWTGLDKKTSDKFWISLRYRNLMGARINLKSPRTLNEKLNWLKLYNRKPIYTQMVDKLAVKELIVNKLGEKYCIPTIAGPWYNANDIDFEQLPNDFVLKINHNSGGVFIVRDKKQLDVSQIKAKLNHSLLQDGFWHSREWPYKDVKPCIFAERYVKDSFSDNLTVYKIFCFNGEPYMFQVISDDKLPSETIDYFDINWNLLELRSHVPNSKIHRPKPGTLNEMIDIARKLSAGIPFVRIDLYDVYGQIYFSEFTFYSDAGYGHYYPDNWDSKLGSMLELPNVSCS